MSDNLTIWEKHADIDPKFTKPITGKQYKGTSPNPQYVVRCLTDLFGPIGQGWGMRVVAEGFQPLGDELLHWCRVEFWHTDRANTFEQYGQTKALMKTKSGFMSDEDAPKKSITDALVKCASYIGVASNIFLGRWDDQKYVAEVSEQYRSADDKAKQAGAHQKTADSMIAALKQHGVGPVTSDRRFQADLAALKSASPETAARVEAEIDTQRKAQSADLGGDNIPY